MSEPILLFPTGTDAHGRMIFTGVKFASLGELRTYQNNANFKDAVLISNGTLYEVEDINQVSRAKRSPLASQPWAVNDGGAE